MSSSLFAILNYLALSLTSICLIFTGHYLYKSFRYRSDLEKFRNAKPGETLPPPEIPSALPWIGIAPSFLKTKPLAFWKSLFEWYPRDVGACTMTMGGRTAHVIFNAPATQYILKDRKLGREDFNEIVIINGLGVSREDCDRYNGFHTPTKPGEIPPHIQQDKINLEYLLKTENATELASQFLQLMQKQVNQEFKDGSGEVNLYQWVRSTMFAASTNAIWGERALEIIPDLEGSFYTFDRDLLSMFYGLPNFMTSKKITNRDHIIDGLMKFYEIADKETGGKISDPDTVAWEPIYGSRIARARQIFARNRGLTMRGIAGLELGFMFGFSSNAVPAVGWLLFHILDSSREEKSPTLYEHIMKEIESSKNKDGFIDMTRLLVQPILQSTVHEVLRIYVDTLVTRQTTQDMIIPLTPEKSEKPLSISVKAGSMLMVPTYPAHTDPKTWQSVDFPHHPPVNIFYPYRFLTAEPSTEKPTFTTAHTTGKFLPFGGGKTMCPGRNFAKQEMMGAVAILLNAFQFEILGYLDEQKKPSQDFPVLRDSLPGSAMMVPGGDLRVMVKRRV